jgi:hypothetical protein
MARVDDQFEPQYRDYRKSNIRRIQRAGIHCEIILEALVIGPARKAKQGGITSALRFFNWIDAAII